jgi:hypothetical protein
MHGVAVVAVAQQGRRLTRHLRGVRGNIEIKRIRI